MTKLFIAGGGMFITSSLLAGSTEGNLDDLSEPITDDDEESPDKKKKRRDAVKFSSGYGKNRAGERDKKRKQKLNGRALEWQSLVIIESS